MSEIKKEEKKDEPKEEIKMRQIVVETDGNIIKIVKADVAGLLELRAILTSLIGYCDNQPKK